jgi:hypothetical protein
MLQQFNIEKLGYVTTKEKIETLLLIIHTQNTAIIH